MAIHTSFTRRKIIGRKRNYQIKVCSKQTEYKQNKNILLNSLNFIQQIQVKKQLVDF